jgi:S1-C subfamily serine protease
VLAGGDVVVAVDGRPVGSADELVRIVTNTLRPGRTAVFGVVRGGSKREIAVRLTARPPR